jgi:hypothetical protein
MIHDDSDEEDSDESTLDGTPDEDAYEFDDASQEREHPAMTESISDPSPHLDLYTLTTSFTHMFDSSNLICADSLCRLAEDDDEGNEIRPISVAPKPIPLPTRDESPTAPLPRRWGKGRLFIKVLRNFFKGLVSLMHECGRGFSEFATSTYRYWMHDPSPSPRPKRPPRAVGDEGDIEMDVLNEKEKDM